MKMHPLLVGSSPTDPVKQAAAKAFGNPPPSIVQPAEQAARDWRYYETTIIRREEASADILKEYKDGGSWRVHYKTWQDACAPLGKSRRQIDRLIQEASDIRTEMPEVIQSDIQSSSVNDLPDPLAELEAQLAKAVVRAGPTQEPEPSAAPIFLAVPDVPRDLIGFPIPASLLERWNQRQEVQDKITMASKLRCALEKIAGKGHQNPLYGVYDWQGMIRTIGQLQFAFGQCKPEVVCYECDGDFTKLKASKGGDGITRHCHNCNDRGFITQSQWDKYAESKLDIIQKRVNARLAKCKED